MAGGFTKVDNRAFTDLGVGSLDFGVYVQMCNEARWGDEGGRSSQGVWVPLSKGQLVFGRRAWAAKFGVLDGVIRGAVKRLVAGGFINQMKAGKNTIITVTYIASEPAANQEETTGKPEVRPITKTEDKKQKTKNKDKPLSPDGDERGDLHLQDSLPGMTDQKAETVPCQAIVELFNEKCLALPSVKVLNQKRKDAIKRRWHDKDMRANALSWWTEYFDLVAKCPLLIGNNSRGWKASFDWLLEPGHMVKVMEGNYLDNRPTAQTRKVPTATSYATTHYTEEAL